MRMFIFPLSKAGQNLFLVKIGFPVQETGPFEMCGSLPSQVKWAPVTVARLETCWYAFTVLVNGFV